jgi:hypothetical protein
VHVDGDQLGKGQGGHGGCRMPQPPGTSRGRDYQHAAGTSLTPWGGLTLEGRATVP